MTPKFLTLTRFASPNDPIMVNPRRVNSIIETRAPSQQPELKGKLGTEILFNSNDRITVKETLDEIKQLLK
jgi:hypothetical protein